MVFSWPAGCLPDQPGEVEVELEGACLDKAVFLKVVEDMLIDVQFPQRRFLITLQRDFQNLELQRINLHQEGEVLHLLFIILVHYIATLSHTRRLMMISRLPIPPQVKTERLSLRRLRYEDAEQIFYAYASKPEATRFVSWATHRSVDDTREYLRYAVHAWNTGMDYTYAIQLANGMLIGSIGMLHENGRIQVGYILSPVHWGRGYATEACRAVLGLVEPLPGVYRIGTFVDAENIASIRVLAKCGMVQEAFLPRWFRFVNQGNAVKDCLLFRLKP